MWCWWNLWWYRNPWNRCSLSTGTCRAVVILHCGLAGVAVASRALAVRWWAVIRPTVSGGAKCGLGWVEPTQKLCGTMQKVFQTLKETDNLLSDEGSPASVPSLLSWDSVDWWWSSMLIPNFILVWANIDFKARFLKILVFKPKSICAKKSLFRSVQLTEYVAKSTENHFSMSQERFSVSFLRQKL